MSSQLFSRLCFDDLAYGKTQNLRELVLNFGPQHPSSHGVLRLIVSMSGEVVNKVDPQIGFLHRGTEKLLEYHTLFSGAVFMDRLDYTSVLTQTHCYCMAVETSMRKLTLNMPTIITRTVFDELARLLNHLLSIAVHSLDIGSMGSLF